jgi:hypothetical protein
MALNLLGVGPTFALIVFVTALTMSAMGVKADPVITSLSPKAGSLYGGTRITMKGTDLMSMGGSGITILIGNAAQATYAAFSPCQSSWMVFLRRVPTKAAARSSTPLMPLRRSVSVYPDLQPRL